jgi:hypothetical protein
MKFWKLLCAAGGIGFLLILLLALLLQGSGSGSNNSDPNAPRLAAPIPIAN